jgi:hypothetical protein
VRTAHDEVGGTVAERVGVLAQLVRRGVQDDLDGAAALVRLIAGEQVGAAEARRDVAGVRVVGAVGDGVADHGVATSGS